MEQIELIEVNTKHADDIWEFRQQNGIVRYLKKNRGEVSITKATGYMISYGWR